MVGCAGRGKEPVITAIAISASETDAPHLRQIASGASETDALQIGYTFAANLSLPLLQILHNSP